MLRIALASPPFPGMIDAALPHVERYIRQAAAERADIVCFPECYIPGLHGQAFPVQAFPVQTFPVQTFPVQTFPVQAHDPAGLPPARQAVCDLAREAGIAVILPMDWDSPEGILNVAFVISEDGESWAARPRTRSLRRRTPSMCQVPTGRSWR